MKLGKNAHLNGKWDVLKKKKCFLQNFYYYYKLT